MMNYTGWDIPEGKVVKVTDASGAVIWALPSASGPIILEVEKITSDTYAAETTYTGEQFILLDIYPKTNGTVKVTYGGLTKTITDTSGAEEPNAQQVFFGTFNGVSDEVETPASGTLTVEGDYRCVGQGTFSESSKTVVQGACGCISAVTEWGGIEVLPDLAFQRAKFESIIIPDGVTSVGTWAFNNCPNLISVTFPESLTHFGGGTFQSCPNLQSVNIPEGTLVIPELMFQGCASLPTITIPASVENINRNAFMDCKGLTNVIVLAATPPALGSDAVFDNTNACPITVPAGCGDAYKTAEYWSEYADRIVEAS